MIPILTLVSISLILMSVKSNYHFKLTMLIDIVNVKPNRDILQKCANIWLIASRKSHYFIEPNVWEQHYQAMCEEYLPHSDLYLAKIKDEIVGFAAIIEDNILAGLFIHPNYWRLGMGQKLINHVINLKKSLQLTVYTENQCAVDFYLKHGFRQVKLQNCDHTGHAEWLMHRI